MAEIAIFVGYSHFQRETLKMSTECKSHFFTKQKSSARLKWRQSRFILCKSWYNGPADMTKLLDLTKIVPEFTSQLHILWNIRLSSVFPVFHFLYIAGATHKNDQVNKIIFCITFGDTWKFFIKIYERFSLGESNRYIFRFAKNIQK